MDWDDALELENEFDEVSNIITLNDENGNEVKFEFLDLVEYDGGDYVILLPCLEDGDEDNGEVVILKVEETEDDDETESYVPVDSEEDLSAVFAIFKEKFKDAFNFTDGDADEDEAESGESLKALEAMAAACEENLNRILGNHS